MWFQRIDKPKVEEVERNINGHKKPQFDRRAAGLKARETNRKRYGENYYKVLGRSGGTAEYKGKKGWAAHPELASELGKIGGAVSKRKRGQSE